VAKVLLQFFGDYNSERILKICQQSSQGVMNECI